MGYTTEFKGRFDLNKPLDDKTSNLLVGLVHTRRVIRRVRKEDGYGIDGEFCIKEGSDAPRCMDYNRSPRTQPSLWLQWTPTKDRMHIQWNGVEKFYGYVAWLEYLSNRVLRPAGYEISGTVSWEGEDISDTGKIVACKGDITVQDATNLDRGYAYEGFLMHLFDLNCPLHGTEPHNWVPDVCRSCQVGHQTLQVERDNDVYYEGGEVEERRRRNDVWDEAM